MEKIDSKVIEFINEHHVLTLATSSNNEPYCANCFYVYFKEENMLVFTSDMETKHIGDVQKQNRVAANIVLETSVIGKIQGVQITGLLSQPSDDLLKKVKKAYLKRFPVAMLMKTNLWVLDVDFIKMTDNRLGFGKKLIWRK